MDNIKNTGKALSKEEQKKIVGGNEYCFILTGGSGTCMTDARCDLDLPLCEPV